MQSSSNETSNEKLVTSVFFYHMKVIEMHVFHVALGIFLVIIMKTWNCSKHLAQDMVPQYVQTAKPEIKVGTVLLLNSFVTAFTCFIDQCSGM